MGMCRTFTCEACGYQASVSGRDDRGFIRATTTILCHDCRELYDVETGAYISDSARRQAIEPRCPKSKKHSFRRWEHPDLCPKCAGEMKEGEPCMLWD